MSVYIHVLCGHIKSCIQAKQPANQIAELLLFG